MRVSKPGAGPPARGAPDEGFCVCGNRRPQCPVERLPPICHMPFEVAGSSISSRCVRSPWIQIEATDCCPAVVRTASRWGGSVSMMVGFRCAIHAASRSLSAAQSSVGIASVAPCASALRAAGAKAGSSGASRTRLRSLDSRHWVDSRLPRTTSSVSKVMDWGGEKADPLN